MSEGIKLWIGIFLTGIIISFSCYMHYTTLVDEANSALQQSQSRLVSMQEQLSVRTKSWKEKELVVNKVQDEADKKATLLKAQETLDLRFHKADNEFKYALESMQTAVDRTRNNAPGTELGEIKLANGKILHDVKIRKVEESGISFIHADGVGKIPTDQLPENLKEQYDLGPNALVPLIQKAQTALLQKSETESIDNPPIIAPEIPVSQPSVRPLATHTIDESKIKNIRLRMAELDSRIASYPKLVAQYQKAAASHQALAAHAKIRGVPSTLHTDAANKSLAQAALLENQKAAMIAERGKLLVEIEYEMKGK